MGVDTLTSAGESMNSLDCSFRVATRRAQEERTLLLSACMVVRNEELTIGRCLRSLRSLVDEIIVVDTGSTARPVELARAIGAIVHRRQWQDDFALHRNFSLSLASGLWRFVVDADEEVVATEARETRRMLRQDGQAQAYLVRRRERNWDGHVAESAILRVFRRSAGIKYEGAVFERPLVPSMPVTFCGIRLIHHGYETKKDVLRKIGRYRELRKRQSATASMLPGVQRVEDASERQEV